jgi:hypothetical protein
MRTFALLIGALVLGAAAVLTPSLTKPVADREQISVAPMDLLPSKALAESGPYDAH